ncbi:hypothetical protein [Aquipuribacter nitratireducens]|uniref:Uncharacterized protein n=1 Tax=Aquipuribacter nitratireducens TaxID=650104 RepID=A0ABW0GR59_9MICO
MADLDVDTDVLRDTGAALRVVATELDAATVHSHVVAEAVGHEGLAEALLDLTRSWRRRREEVLDGIAALAEAAAVAGETFEGLDSELAAALRGRS